MVQHVRRTFRVGALVYGKIGGAWAEEDWNSSGSVTVGGVSATASGSNSFDRYGWMVGASVEYAVTNNLTIKAEYNFLDFGTANETLSTTAGGLLFTAMVPSKLNVNIVKVGVNYLFN
jgi:outer membrane immunogenic protein